MSEVELHVTAMGWRGEGIASHDGKPVFVPFALPSETVRATLDGTRARIVEIVSPSPARAEPFCRHHGTCGGCQLQHWREADYRAWKVSLVEAALASHGIAANLRTLIDAHGAGRRRVSLHVRRKEGTVTAGFILARSHTLLDLDHCPVLVPALEKCFDLGRAIGKVLGDCDVALTAVNEGLDGAVRAERRIATAEHGKLAGLTRHLGLARFTVNSEVIAAPAIPHVRMGKALVPLPPGSFLQATEAGEEALAQLVLAGLGKAKRVADLFSGCGPFTFRIAGQSRVTAFDSDRAAIAALNAAARATPGLKPITAETRDLFRAPLVATELKDFDAVVFDPPRAGAETQARQLAKSVVKTVIAVSCDPTSFARDAAILIEGGYELGDVTAVDQFKWTSHVETVAVFRRGR